jgi:cytochrome c peroxidase
MVLCPAPGENGSLLVRVKKVNLFKFKGIRHHLRLSPLAMLLTLFAAAVQAQTMEEPIRPIPIPHFTAEERAEIALGRLLFHDPRLSRDNSTSCASCHSLELDGVDRRRVSVGIEGAMGTVNAPTVINSSLNIAQFWDGRAATLEEQAAGPVHNPAEMGSSWEEVVAKLRRDELYPARFEAIFEEGLTAQNIQRAIAQFERSLVTINASFDRYLRGDEQAISNEAKQGYRLFKSYGCVACHQGQNVGSNMYARMGAIGNYFLHKEKIEPSDLGRYNVTGDEDDRHVFKVPSLRLVTRTAPYFHDGGAATLEEAVRTMARYQLGRRISKEDSALIIRFLESLVGELYLVEP